MYKFLIHNSYNYEKMSDIEYLQNLKPIINNALVNLNVKNRKTYIKQFCKSQIVLSLLML